VKANGSLSDLFGKGIVIDGKIVGQRKEREQVAMAQMRTETGMEIAWQSL